MPVADEIYGKGGILSADPSNAMVASAYAHDCEDAEELLPFIAKANIAHALTLRKAGVVGDSELASVLPALQTLSNWSPSQYEIDPSLGDIYNVFDNNLKNYIGEPAGWLHAGRARREAVNVAFLLLLRERLLELIWQVQYLLATYVELSKRHMDVFMTDFTYLYHAQPTRLSHYLLTFAYGLSRDLERLENSLDQVNMSPAGSGSVNGTRLSLDRNYIAFLLGFSKTIRHTRDAMWRPDLPLDVINSCVSTLMGTCRFAEELQIWSTLEFGLVQLPDEFCRASVIMPQKRNPYPLTYIRGLTNSLAAKPSAYSSYGRIPSGNPDSRTFIYGDLNNSVDKCSKAVFLFASLIEKIQFDQPNMTNMLKQSDCLATDLADEIVLSSEIDYKTAHSIVGKLVTLMRSRGRALSDVTDDDLRVAAQSVTNDSEGLTGIDLSEILNTESLIEARDGLGSARASEVLGMQEELQELVNLSSQRVRKERELIANAETNLENIIRKFS